MRVLHVIDSLGLGGAQAFLASLLQAIPRSEIECDVAALHGPGEFSPRLAALGIPPRHLAASKFDPRFFPRLRGVIRAGRYDIVHSHLIPSSFLCEKFRGYLGIRKLIAHLHGDFGAAKGERYQNWLERGMYRRIDLLLACSEAVLATAPKTARGLALPNGVDETAFRPASAEERDAARRSLGIAPDAFLVGSAGRLHFVKDYATLVRALALFGEALPVARVALFGSGPEEANLRALARSLGCADRVHFFGYKADVRAALAALDVFVMPSRSEGFGIALVEAMASGLPCAVSDYPAAREIVDDGADALVFPRGSEAALAEAVLTLARDPALRERLGAAARAKVTAKFTAGAMGARMAGIYREVARG